MDRIYHRNVDIFSIEMKHLEGAESQPSFEDLLLNNELAEGDLKVRGKLLSFQVLESTVNFIVGLVETNRSDNIPPLKRRAEERIEPMDLPEGDGLAFGNVFLYDINRKVILYEVNKNGSILNHFVEYVYRKSRSIQRTYTINSHPVLTVEQYEKLQRMTTKTKISLEIMHPKKIAEDQVASKSTMFYLFNKGAKLDSSRLKVEFSVNARHGLSLRSREANATIREIQEQIAMDQVEVQHLRVHGYVDDDRDSKIQVVDLVTERLKGKIELREPRLAPNLLENQRLRQIKSLHERIDEDLIAIFG